MSGLEPSYREASHITTREVSAYELPPFEKPRKPLKRKALALFHSTAKRVPFEAPSYRQTSSRIPPNQFPITAKRVPLMPDTASKNKDFGARAKY